MRKYVWVIYKIENPSGKIYIGKTCDFDRRMKQYKKGMGKKQSLLHRSFEKYGVENHLMTIIEDMILSPEIANQRECFWIQHYKSNRSRFPDGVGLNLTDGADGLIGFKHNKRTNEMKLHQREVKCKTSAIPVVQYDLDGNIIKEFVCQRLAAKETGISRTTLKNILNNKTGYTYLPYIFRRKGESLVREQIKVRGRGTKINTHISNSETLIKRYGKPVFQYSLNGELINRYPSITVAAKETGIIRQSIYRNLVGSAKSVNNFVFKR